MKREDFFDENCIVQAIETDTGIYGLFGKYRPLSNFHQEGFFVNGIHFHTSEAAYMAQKTFHMPEVYALSECSTGLEAKRLGQQVTLRSDWEEVKYSKMLKVLREKFKQSVFCRDLLLSTGSKYIEESNWWNDNYWGKCHAYGLNNLGKILMQIRTEIIAGREIGNPPGS